MNEVIVNKIFNNFLNIMMLYLEAILQKPATSSYFCLLVQA